MRRTVMTSGIRGSGTNEVVLASVSRVPDVYPATIRRLWVAIERFALGSITLAMVTVLSLRFHFNIAIIVSLYLLIVVLLSLISPVMSAIVTAAAEVCLMYFFLPPLFSFWIDDPLNRLTLFTFLAMPHVVTWLVWNARKSLHANEKGASRDERAARLREQGNDMHADANASSMAPARYAAKQENCMRGSAIPHELIYRQVSQITASHAFSKSVRLKRLLEFIVDATIKGRTNSLKEWVIGTDVYNRGPNFDPRLDPIVRTEIRRLRRKLREYFETEGREASVVIEVPKGSYIPTFRGRGDDDFFKLPGESIGDYFVLNRLDQTIDTETYRVRRKTGDRIVMLKLISGEALASRGARQALEADILAATALQHENICGVHGFLESGRNICVITEYVEGQSIADVVDRNPPTWEQTLEMAWQLASALTAAHRLRIVHGSLNLRNVIVSPREAGGEPALKIADFGLRFLAEATGDGFRFPAAELDAFDARSDVRAAGIVLRKLFTGSVRECEDGGPSWRKEVPKEKRSAITAILARCLAETEADCYTDAGEIEDGLDFLGAKSCPRAEENKGSSAPARKSQAHIWWRHALPHIALRNLVAVALIFICMVLVAGAKRWVAPSGRTDMIRRLAVLPVECPSGDHECEVLGLAFTRSLQTRLTATDGLEVVRADASSQFKGRTLSVLQVGSRLNVDHLFTTTVEKHKDDRRFSARIVRVADQAVLWAGQFECSWNALVEVQSQLLNDLMVVVNRHRPSTQRSRPREHFAAHSAEEQELYARARHAVDTLITVREQVYFDYAEKQLRIALRSNPEFNGARILLAQLYYQEIWGSPQRSQFLKNSRSLLEAAIEKEPERAEAQ